MTLLSELDPGIYLKGGVGVARWLTIGELL